jgi:putative hydrolase of the HAD superfamily
VSLRAVTLDAAGTLIDVAEPVGETYARTAARHGIALVGSETECRFREAFVAAPPLAFPGVPPPRLADAERAWWRALVRAAFGDAAASGHFEPCFAELFDHFAQPGAWRVHPDAPDALVALRRRRLALGVVSNFDRRLRNVLDGLGVGRLVDAIVPSTGVGAAKPEPALFHAAAAILGVRPGDILHAGDGPATDVAGARAAGLKAVLVDRQGRHPASLFDTCVVRSLAELPTVVDRLDAAR